LAFYLLYASALFSKAKARRPQIILQNAYYIIEGYILHKGVDGLNPGKPSSFEDQSFTNQVNYHEKELRRILKGTSASKIFVLSERHRLLRYGVLIRKGRGKHVRWMVSERARDILEV
jgi:hypothetical protein